MSYWNTEVKRALKSELIRRGFSSAELVHRLNQLGVEETKSSVDSKISRGTFSAAFLFQCLTAIGCKKIEIEEFQSHALRAAEEQAQYQTNR